MAPAYVVNDSLDHLACLHIFSANRGVLQKAHFQSIFQTACHFLVKYGELSGSAALSQRTILVFTEQCTRDELVRLTTLLEKYHSGLHTGTKLHIMERLVFFGEVDRALRLLQTVPMLELSMGKVQSFCVGLLRTDLAVEDLYSLRNQILTYILHIGLRPNRIMSNVVMLNAAEAGDLSTTWTAHDIAEDNGLVPDEYTYAILLKAARLADSKDHIKVVYENAKKAGFFTKSPHLGFELLYAVFQTEDGKFATSPYMALLPLYQEFYDTSSLQDLGLPVGQQAASHQDSALCKPSTEALSLMLRAWLQQYCLTGHVQGVYERYVHGVSNGHAEISKLAETTYSSNAFIIAFSRGREQLGFCTTVVQNMLKPPDPTTEVSVQSSIATDGAESCTQKPSGPMIAVKVAPPDVQTWSILLFAFVCNNKPNAAERVLNIMKRRGHSPNEVTWNSLLNHYTRAQDLSGVVNTVERMEIDGFDTDDYTIKALSHVYDRSRLIEAFQEATKRTETRRSEEALSETSGSDNVRGSWNE